MYWIYFTFTVLVIVSPVIFNERFETLHGTYWHDISIVALAIIGLILFHFEERRLKKIIQGRRVIQKESRLIFDDLTNAYSYIGEANRKMEIVKNILIKTSNQIKDEEQNTYTLILEAIRSFSKSHEVTLRFVDIRNNQTLKEVSTDQNVFAAIRNQKIFATEGRIFEDGPNIFVKNSESIDNIRGVAILKKSHSSQKIEDPSAVQAILAQALSFFIESTRDAHRAGV